MVTDVYEQYFRGECVFNEVPRRACIVKLTSDSEAGFIRYTVSVSFFPFRDDEDYAVSYDAYAEKEIYNAKGRRSKKREKGFMKDLRDHADELALSMEGKVLWDEPLKEARTA
jgi:hypothetical protein